MLIVTFLNKVQNYFQECFSFKTINFRQNSVKGVYHYQSIYVKTI